MLLWIVTLGGSILEPLPGLAQGPSVLHGRVSDEDGLPVPAAEVEVAGTALRASATADGRYRITGLNAGTLVIVASAPGFRPESLQVAFPREGESVRRDVTLARSVVQLEAVTAEIDRAGGPFSRRVLRKQDIARAGSVAAALARVPGVFVKSYGAGGPQQVSIRGGSPDQTLVLWGGERLATPAGGALDLRDVATDSIDSLEVILHGGSSRYGPGALAGVLLIHPASAPVGRGVSLSAAAGAGSLGSREGAAGAALRAGRVGLVANGSLRSYAREFGGRENAGGREADGYFSFHLPELGVAAALAAHAARRGAPGPVFDPAPRARIAAGRLLATTSYEGRAAGWSVRGEASMQRASAEYDDSERSGSGSESRESVLALRTGAARELAGNRLEGGLELRHDRIEATDVAGRPERLEMGVYAGARWRPWRELPLALSPAVRLDHVSARSREPGFRRDDAFVSPSLTAAFPLGAGVSARAHAGRALRYPEFQTLFFVSGLGVRSNPDLREERSRDLELAVDWSPSADVSLSGAAFDRRIDGTIVWLPDFRFVWSPRNLPRARVRGLELSGRWRFRRPWEVNAAYSYAPARFDFAGNENPLPYRPAHVGRIELAYDRGTFRSAAEARLTGRRYPNVAGTNALAGYVLADWTFGWRPDVGTGELELEATVENLLDIAYEVVFGFPGAGRGVTLALRYRAS